MPPSTRLIRSTVSALSTPPRCSAIRGCLRSRSSAVVRACGYHLRRRAAGELPAAEAVHDGRQQGEEGGEVNASTAVVEEAQANVGATVMGRNMFGGGPGPWREDRPWNGWWGDNPPFHTPVFVLTNHSREPLEMKGRDHLHLRHRWDRGRVRAGEAGRGRSGCAAGRRRQRRPAVPGRRAGR